MYVVAGVCRVPSSVFYLFFEEQRCCKCTAFVWLDAVFDVVMALYLVSKKKLKPLSPTILVASAASTLTSNLSPMLSLTKSSSLSIVKFARKLVLGSPKSSTKLPAYRINWLSYNNIRCKLFKFTKQDKTLTIKEDLLSLCSNFLTSEIRFALVATVSKLERDIQDIPVKKNKLIDFFSQLIFDKVLIFGSPIKSAEWYV